VPADRVKRTTGRRASRRERRIDLIRFVAKLASRGGEV
jgi:hypothetical protein